MDKFIGYRCWHWVWFLNLFLGINIAFILVSFFCFHSPSKRDSYLLECTSPSDNLHSHLHSSHLNIVRKSEMVPSSHHPLHNMAALVWQKQLQQTVCIQLQTDRCSEETSCLLWLIYAICLNLHGTWLAIYNYSPICFDEGLVYL